MCAILKYGASRNAVASNQNELPSSNSIPIRRIIAMSFMQWLKALQFRTFALLCCYMNPGDGIL